jgi:hypothetical protein
VFAPPPPPLLPRLGTGRRGLDDAGARQERSPRGGSGVER